MTKNPLFIYTINIAHEFVGVVAQALDDKYVRYNH